MPTALRGCGHGIGDGHREIRREPSVRPIKGAYACGLELLDRAAPLTTLNRAQLRCLPRQHALAQGAVSFGHLSHPVMMETIATF